VVLQAQDYLAFDRVLEAEADFEKSEFTKVVTLVLEACTVLWVTCITVLGESFMVYQPERSCFMISRRSYFFLHHVRLVVMVAEEPRYSPQPNFWSHKLPRLR